ncbi:thiamine pyrophosphate-binding protein [Terasakiella sp. SH-1]|uniref:thiamine pyrophosphate-binding protein n=1 Tax=Terasakiella sp. SH-1 TaxID=2560057 RepID=UPI001074836C|nr:thiamine pyrophosphate-binding protein [Terasakiella sp. SH-1]
MTTNKKIRLADFVFQYLADKGGDHVFLLPGGGAMHLVDGAGRTEGVTCIPCHHEQAAGIAAEAHSRITGKPGVALVTTGPGTTNIVTPVTGAWIESVPMVVVSGQAKRADRIGDSGVRQMGVQEVEIVEIVKSVTKYAVTVNDPTEILIHLEKALHLATTGRKGPVWLDIPLDVQASQIEPDTLKSWHGEEQDRFEQTDEAVTQALSLLKTAKRPLFMIGHGVRLSGGEQVLRQAYEALGIPVVTTWNAMDMIADTHPLSAGKPGSVALRGANFAVQNCDLLISVGARLDQVVTAYAPDKFARGAQRLIVDIDPQELEKLGGERTQKYISDAKAFFEKLIEQQDGVKLPDFTPWQVICQQWKKRYPINDGAAFPTTGEISSFHLTDVLSDKIPEDTLVVTGSSGLAVEAFYTAFRNKEGQRVMLTSGLGSMGYGLPAAIGACLANDSKPMVCVESDGSLQLNLQELSTLYQQQLPICMFIMNNAGYGSIRNTQRNYFDGRFVGTGKEAGLHIPDIVGLCDTIGLATMRITCVDELERGIEQALAHQGPLVCDVRLIEDEVLWPKSAAIPQEDGSMLSMPLEDMSPLLPLDELKDNMVVDVLPASVQARS